MRRKLGSLMCSNNTCESQEDWLAHFYCTTNIIHFFYYNCWNFNHNFHSYCWLFLLSSSIASSSLLCNNNAVHLLNCRWMGKYCWSHYADVCRQSAAFKVMEKAWKLHHKPVRCLQSSSLGSGVSVRSGKLGLPMPDWKNEPSLQSFWDKTLKVLLRELVKEITGVF